MNNISTYFLCYMLAIVFGLSHSEFASHTNEHHMADHQVAAIDVQQNHCFRYARDGYWKIPVVDLSLSSVGSFTSETKSYMPEGTSDSLSLVEAMCSDVATIGSTVCTDTGTMQPEEVLGLG
jgi:hypothetical protein